MNSCVQAFEIVVCLAEFSSLPEWIYQVHHFAYKWSYVLILF